MGRAAAPASTSTARVAGRLQSPLVLVVVAIHAQQFPVAAIRRVVVVIVIAVMDRQLAQIGPREFAGTATADPRIDLERALPVSLLALRGGASAM